MSKLSDPTMVHSLGLSSERVVKIPLHKEQVVQGLTLTNMLASVLLVPSFILLAFMVGFFMMVLATGFFITHLPAGLFMMGGCFLH